MKKRDHTVKVLMKSNDHLSYFDLIGKEKNLRDLIKIEPL